MNYENTENQMFFPEYWKSLTELEICIIVQPCCDCTTWFQKYLSLSFILIFRETHLQNKNGEMSNEWFSLRWRHNDHAGVSNHQPHGCLLNRLFRRKSKKTSKLRVTGLCAGNSPRTGEFPAQMASYAENVSIWWRHHVLGVGILSQLHASQYYCRFFRFIKH